MLNIFAVSPHLNPPLNNPGKVYVESISLKADMRVSSSVLYRTMVASVPTEVLRVADSKTINRTRLMGFFIVDGDCPRRLVRIILSSVR